MLLDYLQSLIVSVCVRVVGCAHGFSCFFASALTLGIIRQRHKRRARCSVYPSVGEEHDPAVTESGQRGCRILLW